MRRPTSKKFLTIILAITMLTSPFLGLVRAEDIAVSTSGNVASYLSPRFNMQSDEFKKTVGEYSQTTDSLEELKEIDPQLIQEMDDVSREFKAFLKTITIEEARNPENQKLQEFKKRFTDAENRLRERSQTRPQKSEYSKEEMSLDMANQRRLCEELINDIKTHEKLTDKQKETLVRWSSYSLNGVLPYSLIDGTPEENAFLYARLREGFRDIVNLIVQYSEMLKTGEVNPDAVKLRVSPEDNTSEVRFDKVTLPDGTVRRSRVISFPAKNDPGHLGHIITILNGLVSGKADKFITEIDNFDHRKSTLTSLVLRQLTAQIMTGLINDMFDKEVVVYSPWMRQDHTFQPDGEHILPLIIEHNARVTLNAVTNVDWKHGAGGDHQGHTYTPKKSAILDCIGKVMLLREKLRGRLGLGEKDLSMGNFFNGRPGETASELLIAGQKYMSGNSIVTSVQRLQVSSTDLRDKGIWSFLPYEIAVLAKILHVPRWEDPALVGEKEQQQQMNTAKDMIEYLKKIIPQVNKNIDTKKIKDMLKGARGLALQEIDTFINFNRDQLLKLADGESHVDLYNQYEYGWVVQDKNYSIVRVEAIRALLFDKVEELWETESSQMDNVFPVAAGAMRRMVELIKGGDVSVFMGVGSITEMQAETAKQSQLVMQSI
ncbi:MAG: hypothetical protein GY853_08015 [PVC group bacterium]|nr:hypothetical protein [PVC group bacterium]